MRIQVAFTALIVTLIAAAQLSAGGFWLQLGNPEANPEARKAGAVVTIQAVGCHNPAAAQVTATAIGVVNGRRQTIPLKVTPLPDTGMFGLSQQWPKEGRWVIQLVGRNGEQVTNTLVAANADGVDRYHARNGMKQFSEGDIAAMLQ